MSRCAVFATVLLSVSLAAALRAADLAPLTVRDVGHYAICPWPAPDAKIEPGSALDRMKRLDFTIRNIWVRDEEAIKSLPETAKRTIDEVNNGLKYDPPKTMIIRIDFWASDRYEGPLKPFEVYQERMEAALKALEPILDKIHGVSVSEENIVSDGRPEVFAKMYRFIKGKYPNLRVYQWYSPNTCVPGTFEGVWVPADGWIIDPYSLGPDLYPNGPTTRRVVQKYIVTGKPLVFIAPGWNFNRFFSPGKPNESFPRGFDGWKNIDDQLQVCLDYNVPVSWYWFYAKNDDITAGGDSAWFPLKAETELGNKMNARIAAWIDQVAALPKDYDGTPAADTWDNPPWTPKINPGRNVLIEDFTQADFLDQTSGAGLRDLVWNGQDLAVRGYKGRPANVAMEYHIKPNAPLQLPFITLKAMVDPRLDGKVAISISNDQGKTWPVKVESKPAEGRQDLKLDSRPDGWRNGGPFKEVPELWVRIEITGQAGSDERPPVRIDDVQIGNLW